MKDRDLDELEQTANTILNGKDREIALQRIAELRLASKAPSNAKQGVPRNYQSPDFRNFGFFRLLELLTGAAVFVVLCFSLTLLAPLLGSLLGGDTRTSNIVSIFLALISIAGCATLLCVLAGKTKTEKIALRRNPITKKFAKQKLMLQASSLGLFAVTVTMLVITAPIISKYLVAPYIISFVFLFGYSILARTLWRCPACNSRLSFTNQLLDRQSIEYCPHCNAKLQ